MRDTNSAFADLLNSENNRGVRAAIEALSEMGVIHYSPEKMCYVTTKMEISEEALRHIIDRKLNRR